MKRQSLKAILLIFLAGSLVGCRGESVSDKESAYPSQNEEKRASHQSNEPLVVVDIPGQERRCVLVGEEEVCWPTPEEGSYLIDQQESL